MPEKTNTDAFGFLGVVLAAPLDQHSISNIFKPVSAPADFILHSAILVMYICLGIFLVVGGLMMYTIIRFRRRSEGDTAEPPQVSGSNQIEIAWTVIPLLIVFVLLMVTARVIASVQDHAVPANAVHATVVGHQWWWEIHYPELGIITANELHVPVSDQGVRRPTFLKLQSADVIHSFWVPQLAGKTDVIPNHTNEMWIEPRETGAFPGNCAEYCGTQHANMLLHVVVHPVAEFEQWVAAQRKPAVVDAKVSEGRVVFESHSCVNCHLVQGTPAKGVFGPDLTHLMGRFTIGSGMVANDPAHLKSWVKDPQDIKPGCLMPSLQLSDQQLDQVVAYLLSLT